MGNQERIRVFIGSGEASLLERKVSIYSLRKTTQRALDIYVFNGTHNSIELNDEEPFLAPLSLKLKYRNTTEFSLYRYLIPQICNYQGKAIYIDSDTICLADIGELFDTPLGEYNFLTKADSYSHLGESLWGLSVMLINCETARFDLECYYQEIEQGLYTERDLSQMSPAFLQHHPFKIGKLDPAWNSFDYYDRTTKLIHYTDLYRQPWKAPDHPYGELWFRHFREAIAAGFITDQDIELSLVRSYVRRDILQGNSPPPQCKAALKRVFSFTKASMQNLLKVQPA
ncbi:glycosyltransferase [Leptolyngbya sp. O-77]|uniref:glycosyltransferase n=1 Tax=Leptolyngbya sp. O-77 TaxID=1080068 RepID=UPI00074D2A71|nr:glycosyltransferase [Leptolyngbya sp. O-77]BAU43992.1 Glycosyl transferase family 8 [Leptolyngbya sp. O-77]